MPFSSLFSLLNVPKASSPDLLRTSPSPIYLHCLLPNTPIPPIKPPQQTHSTHTHTHSLIKHHPPLQIRPRRLGSPRLTQQIRLPLAILTRLASTQRTRRRRLGHIIDGFFEGIQQRLCRFGREIFVIVVVDLHHGGVDACAQTLDFNEREQAVGRGLAGLDAQVGLDGLDNDVGAAAAELAGGLFPYCQYN